MKSRQDHYNLGPYNYRPCAPVSSWLFKKRGKHAIGRSCGGRTCKISLVAANDCFALTFSLAAGNEYDAPVGRVLLRAWTPPVSSVLMTTDRAYLDDETFKLLQIKELKQIVPPRSNVYNAPSFDREIYKKRNTVECLFRRLKEFRRIFTHYDKLDSMFAAFIIFGLIILQLKR